jgi:hypothetical protein
MSPLVTREDPARDEGGAVESEARELARGRAARTPFELIVAVAVVVWSVAALIAGAVLLVWWLA